MTTARKAVAHDNSAIVASITGKGKGWYANYQYEQGIAWLEYYCQPAPELQRLMAGSRVFWNWWRNHWYQIDRDFIATWIEFDHKCEEVAVRMYHEYHDIESFHFTPNRAVMELCFADKVVQALIQEEEAAQ